MWSSPAKNNGRARINSFPNRSSAEFFDRDVLKCGIKSDDEIDRAEAAVGPPGSNLDLST
jgi:hypothetical protein